MPKNYDTGLRDGVSFSSVHTLLYANEKMVEDYVNTCVKKRFGRRVAGTKDFIENIDSSERWLTYQNEIYKDLALGTSPFPEIVKLVAGEQKQEDDAVMLFDVAPTVLQFRWQMAWLSNMFPSLTGYNANELLYGHDIAPAYKELMTQREVLKEQSLKNKSNKLIRATIDAVRKECNVLAEKIASTFMLKDTGTSGLVDGVTSWNLPVQDRLITFASVEHAFMAQKANCVVLLKDAVLALTAFKVQDHVAKASNPKAGRRRRRGKPSGGGGEGEEPLATLIDDTAAMFAKSKEAMKAMQLFTDIRTADTAKDAKKRANSEKTHLVLDGPTTWAAVNRHVMALALVKKFQQNEILAQLLQKMVGHHLIEGNYFNDIAWGCAMYRMPWVDVQKFPTKESSKGRLISTVIKDTNGDAVVVKGCNWLGKALMALSTLLSGGEVNGNKLPDAPPPLPATRLGKHQTLMMLQGDQIKQVGNILASVMNPVPFFSKDDRHNNPFDL